MASGRSSHSSRLWHTMLPAVKEPRRVPALVFSSEVEATLLRAQRLQQLDDLLSLEVLCPSERGGPVCGISGRQVRSALDEQFHGHVPSTASPAKRHSCWSFFLMKRDSATIFPTVAASSREEQRAWMIRKPDRGSLLRPEQEGLFAEGRAHALAALSRDDERHHARRGGQVQDFARGGGDKGNRMACDRAGRLDMCGLHERRRKQHSIKGTPGKEGLSVHLEAMACRHQGHAPAEDVALLVKLCIGQLPQSSLQFVLVELEPRP